MKLNFPQKELIMNKETDEYVAYDFSKLFN